MTIERGLLINGQVVPGTEFIVRDSDAWWDWDNPDDRHDLVKRASTDIELLVGHWTAGTAGDDEVSDDGRTVVRRMKARMSRKYEDEPLKAAVEFIIAADSDSQSGRLDDATVWQCMDIGKVAGIHVGNRNVCRRAVGVEIVNIGVPYYWRNGKKHDWNPRKRPIVNPVLLNKKREFTDFFQSQYLAWRYLAETLASLDAFPEYKVHIPRVVPGRSGKLHTGRMSRRDLVRDYAGAMEHYHMWNTNKVDAGSLLVRDLHENQEWALKF